MIRGSAAADNEMERRCKEIWSSHDGDNEDNHLLGSKLKTGVTDFSKTSVNYCQSTRHHIPEYISLNNEIQFQECQYF